MQTGALSKGGPPGGEAHLHHFFHLRPCEAGPNHYIETDSCRSRDTVVQSCQPGLGQQSQAQAAAPRDAFIETKPGTC